MIPEIQAIFDEATSKESHRKELKRQVLDTIRRQRGGLRKRRQRADYCRQLVETGVLKTKWGVQAFLRWGELELSNEESTRLTQMRMIRTIFGKCEDTKCYSLQSAERRLIRVQLCVGIPGIKVDYVTELPGDAKCQIVETKSHDLFCPLD